ncbi:hypothetical protein DYB32_005615 [Aphanomyces invadans]|uniref:phospholipase D n=1 Tax=Aphanomyces invadans TaxID=157072 RepID=A0A3R6Z342_9STRA|nr:hypothetical protein DYB32_005615 [Aphanomyces invadans]
MVMATGPAICTKDISVKSLLVHGCVCKPCHRCVYTALGGCQLDVSKAVTLSDGSDVPTRQPLLDPHAWFLTEAEITASRNGVPRHGMHAFSSNNSVHVFAATDEYFRAKYDDISATTAQDAVYFSAWTLNDVAIIPDVNPNLTLQTLWGEALHREVPMAMLVWANIRDAKPTMAMFNWFQNQTPKANTSQFILDDRVTPLSGSLHQKFTVLRRHGKWVAYVGGVDYSVDRWDTKFHNSTQLRKAAKIKVDYDGWIDVHTRIHGPAISDVLGTFLGRWNNPTLPSIPMAFSLAASTSPNGTDIPQHLPVVAMPPTNAIGTHHVQITRTYSCVYTGYNSFAPRGETSILASRLKAIRNARNYIYVEDQYFVHVPELLAALVHVLPTIQRLVVVTCKRGAVSAAAGYDKFLYDMVAPLQVKFPNKVHVFRTIDSIFVHSKVVLIDDVFLSIGSSNWNVRSMTSDAELTTNIVDAATTVGDHHVAVAALARQFRVAKFAELTRFSIDFDPLTVVQAANALAAYATSVPDALIVPYDVQYELYFDLYNVQGIVDGDGRCKPSGPSTMLSACRPLSQDTNNPILRAACDCRNDPHQRDVSTCMAQMVNVANLAAQVESTRLWQKAALVAFAAAAIGCCGVLLGHLFRRHWRRRVDQTLAIKVRGCERESLLSSR